MSWVLIFIGILFICVALWKPLGFILGIICIVSGLLINDYEDFEARPKEQANLQRHSSNEAIKR